MDNFEILTGLLKKNRSYRRFDESIKISKQSLIEIVSLTRYCASGRNLQPLKYYLITGEKDCDKLFPLLGWAGYLKDWAGPVKGERPVAYIIQCLDLRLTDDCMCDDGIQLQTITLGAVSLNYGCCIIKSFNPDKVNELFLCNKNLKPLHVIAVGVPVENVILTQMETDKTDNIKYYRDEMGNHYVPKRDISELIINI